ncbi:hypothetical protein NEDG_01036 [Nematocida displodere]|uniref:SUI1 domain-containing protein n=1 Tax=Nematocida displodere TaxID=1805483 RepID=A0A177EAD9_9MICR|nr:hypothetical protein NEDG_01036 [Nematocida displodere]
MSEALMYCEKCSFPTEYCEYSPICTGTKKEVEASKEVKITVTTKKVTGNKKVTLVKNLQMLMSTQQIKEVAKKLSKTIACGASLVKNGSGTDDISVQTSEDLRVIDILARNGVPKDKIERITKSK